jgi:dTDP-4-amino-4,6-dideoxygalactose transaminase
MVDLDRQSKIIDESVWTELKELVSSSNFIGGKHLLAFEKEFATFLGTSYFSGVANGTVAIELALRASGVKAGDEVITVAHTFFATVEAILNVGAKPIFVDIDLNSGLMDTTKVSELINTKTKAIIPVHLYGHVVNMQPLLEICKTNNLTLIEDTSQAHGAKYHGKTAGTIGDFGIFSFYPGKNLGAWGDSGGIAARSENSYNLINKLRDHGRSSKYVHDLIGTNARMDPIQGIILSAKLKHLEKWNTRRTEIANQYISCLDGTDIQVIKPNDDVESVWHLFVLRVSNREEVQNCLNQIGIETGVHYPIPLHLQPAIMNEYKDIRLPNTEQLSGEIISIPIHGLMYDNEVSHVISNFLKIARFK